MPDPREEEIEAVTEAILSCNSTPGPKLTHAMAWRRARAAIAALDAARSTQPEGDEWVPTREQVTPEQVKALDQLLAMRAVESPSVCQDEPVPVESEREITDALQRESDENYERAEKAEAALAQEREKNAELNVQLGCSEQDKACERNVTHELRGQLAEAEAAVAQERAENARLRDALGRIEAMTERCAYNAAYDLADDVLSEARAALARSSGDGDET